MGTVGDGFKKWGWMGNGDGDKVIPVQLSIRNELSPGMSPFIGLLMYYYSKYYVVFITDLFKEDLTQEDGWH
jgi:hypothetical protein